VYSAETFCMSNNDTVLRFEKVHFSYSDTQPILDGVDFVVRRGAKLTLMGQNGAGKSTIFSLITGEQFPEAGRVIRSENATVAIARQVVPREQMDYTVREFFEACFSETVYDIDKHINAILEVVNLHAEHTRHIRSFSGGQQARLLLASALIQNPDILLLDEPTNNLDKAGIAHLTDFLVAYKKTCLVISHDADFLNTFTHGVLYLDVHTHKIEQYKGNYHDVVRDISARVEKENRKNAQLAKQIQEKKDKANVFAHKGGGMRSVAKRMREKAEEMEESKVDVRKEDKTIRPFTIPVQEGLPMEVVRIDTFEATVKHKIVTKKARLSIGRKDHVHLIGPNGMGKSRLLAKLAEKTAEGAVFAEGVSVGYYRQDFSMLDFEKTVYETLISAMTRSDEQHMRSVAAGFLLTGDMMRTKIGSLSEGQKGLVGFAYLVLLRPGLLMLDEPTNHINFRHLPIIAKALDAYEGAMILVSHVPEFVSQIKIDTVLDLEK
jgi:ATPase subunit of ABC transporter with duplicated ATPase domains